MIRPAGQLRIVVCLVVLAVVFWATPSPGVVELAGVLPGGFIDVSSEHWAYGEIIACLAAGIAAGYEDGTYHPEFSVSRAQMAVYISRALAGGDDNVPDGPDTATFDDVPTDHWAYRYVEYCVANGVVQGYDAVTYAPTVPLSRAAMAVFISRAVAGGDGNVPDGPAEATFDDVPTDNWAYKYVEYCAAEGIVHGYDPVTYGPTITVSRAQMAVYIQRAFELPIPDGPPAPDFTLQTLDGTQQYRLSELRGMPVAVFFWTSWCSYCAPQASDLETLYQRYRDQSFLVLGVGLDDPAALQQKAEALGLTFPVGYNPAAGELYDVQAIPHTFIIDRSGSISSSLLGLQPMDTLEAAIMAVL